MIKIADGIAIDDREICSGQRLRRPSHGPDLRRSTLVTLDAGEPSP